MKIKRTFCVSMFTICLIGGSVCSKIQPTMKVIETSDEHKQVVTITYQSIEEEIKDKNGVPMLFIKGNLPSVEIKGSPVAAKKINAFYEKRNKDFEMQKATYFKQAQEDYSMRTEEEKKYWQGYGLGNTYSQIRVDDAVISLIENNYQDTAGAHPNSWRYAQNFNTQTGQRLTLSDVTTDVKVATTFINDYILKLTKEATYKDYFFEGYEKNIKDILTEDTWYFSDEGLVIICNEYIISPHVVGILEFTIPYEHFPYLKPAYIPKK